MKARTGREKLLPGRQAPPFSLRDAGGANRSLEGILADGPALLAFFKVSCPTCQLTLPFLERFHRQANGRFQVFGVSQDQENLTQAFAQEFGLTFPMLLDDPAEYPVSNAFGITHVPSIYWIDRAGDIRDFQEGFAKQDLENLGRTLGVQLFRPEDNVPDWKAG
jgi:peroxiredoxin